LRRLLAVAGRRYAPSRRGGTRREGEEPLTSCPLCRSFGCTDAGRSLERELLHCPDCGLVFVPESRWLTVEAERARYAHHDNTATNEGYARFLGEVADVVCGLTLPGARVLDFGSGEHAVLAGLLLQRGREGVAHDPLYDIGPDALRARYDAIVLCEVIEHLRDLRAELSNIVTCLAPGARVVVRTRCYPSIAELPSWWYARDPTHIRFFASRTLELAARLCGLRSRPTPLADVFVWSPCR
jgi:hypothetical protein